MMRIQYKSARFKAMYVLILASSWVLPSSHREAPFVTENPKVDGTDFYTFRSYEEGRDGFVTLIANYIPQQDAYGGPNYYSLDSNAAYNILVDNNADGTEDLTFRFRFTNASPFLTLGAGNENTPISVANIGPFGPPSGNASLNLQRTYTVDLTRGAIGAPGSEIELLQNTRTGGSTFEMPFDNIGAKSIPNYSAYATEFIYDVKIPGCQDGRLFVGQRRESFAVNLGDIFDLVNLDPVGDPASKRSSTEDKNITSLALEVPIDCLGGESGIIGAWTTSHLPRNRILRTEEEGPTFDDPAEETGDLVQVSRLANPLVNTLVIGLQDKNLFNSSHPQNDSQFLRYFHNPWLSSALAQRFQIVTAPTNFPRFDLSWWFLQGIPGINFTENGALGEVLRLNTSIPAVPAGRQNSLGVVGNDNAGYPNGRRPGDDVVDIFLQVMNGRLCVDNPATDPRFPLGACQPADALSGHLALNDQTYVDSSSFGEQFPYLNAPLPGSRQEDDSGCGHKIYFPRVVVEKLAGADFTSLLTLKNLTRKTCTGTLSFYQNNFNPMGLVRCNGTLFPLGRLDITLAALRGRSFSCDRPAGGAQGFAVFEPGPGCWPSDFTASAKIQVSPEEDENSIVDLIGLTSSSEPSTSFRFDVERKIHSGNWIRETAFSIAPCDPEPYDYTLEFWALSGGTAVTRQGTATGPLARFVSELLSDLGDEYEGSLYLETSRQIQPEVLSVVSGPGVQGGLQLSPVLFDRNAKRHSPD